MPRYRTRLLAWYAKEGLPFAEGDAERYVMELVQDDCNAINKKRMDEGEHEEDETPVESTIRVWVTGWTIDYRDEHPDLSLPDWAAKLRRRKQGRGHLRGDRQPPGT